MLQNTRKKHVEQLSTSTVGLIGPSLSELLQMQQARGCDGCTVCDMCCSDPTMIMSPENVTAVTNALGLGGWHIRHVAGAHSYRLQSCPGRMFYSWHQAVYPFMSYRIPPVQVWLGLDNTKSACRGDTTPQDVIEAIIMLSGRDVQELRL